MFHLIFYSILAAFFSGLLIKWGLKKFDIKSDYNSYYNPVSYRISSREFLVTFAIIAAVTIPITCYIGWKVSQNNRLTFNEFRNGWETEAIKDTVKCYRDGPCRNSYDCDPYIVMVTYSCNCDKNGCRTCTRAETRYHSCPYCNFEYSYYVETTLGRYTIDHHRFPNNPNENRWRKTVRIPDNVINRAGTGDPKFWAEAKARLDSNSPGPVTKVFEYQNFLLASENTILRKYAGDITDYLEDLLLPSPIEQIYNFYHANKLYTVGNVNIPKAYWARQLEYMNGGLGSLREGDARIVVVNHKKIHDNPDRYVQTLQPYWQLWQYHDDNALAKNSIVLVLGTEDNQTVAWARLFTGMPVGNERLAVSVNGLFKGKPLDADTIIGTVKSNRAFQIQVSDGLARASIIDPQTKFTRESMKPFEYLKREIQPLPAQQKWIMVIAFFMSMLCWLVPVLYHDAETRIHDFKFKYKGW